MKGLRFVRTLGVSVLIWNLALFLPVSVPAQEQEGQEKSRGRCCMMGMEEGSGMEGMQGTKGRRRGMMAEMRQMHEQMEAMHEEMIQELQKQLTALREHAKAMEGIADDKHLLGEMRKHQQLTDDLLATMVEQRVRMHARMKERHQQMRRRMQQRQQTEKQVPEGHETHQGED